jgi:hypothetical protein
VYAKRAVDPGHVVRLLDSPWDDLRRAVAALGRRLGLGTAPRVGVER